ncbi:MAG: ribosome recycling factor [Cyclobacteriaceae bacterium]
MEELDFYLDHAREQMDKSIEHTVQAMSKIRAGKAMPNMLDGLMVEYYGNPTPLNQVASVTTPDARTLAIKPWEKGTIPDIEKAIINSDLGLNPQNDGEMVRINIPPLTEERRIQLVKQAKHEAEQGKISLRSVRKETNDQLKKLEGVSEDLIKDAETEVQSITDNHSKRIDEILAVKEKDIMTI